MAARSSSTARPTSAPPSPSASPPPACSRTSGKPSERRAPESALQPVSEARPAIDRLRGDEAGGTARPVQPERREQPVALIALRDGRSYELARHGGRAHAVAAKAHGVPDPWRHLADLHH